jgi:hypothetical protein
MNPKYNIVQAEFFHVRGDSLEELIQDCNQRIAENLPLKLQGNEVTSGIKTVVRFFDQKNRCTSIVRKATKFQRRKHRLTASLLAGKYSWFAHNRYNRLQEKLMSLKARARDVVQRELSKTVRSYGAVAIERWDHSFRLLRSPEAHEVIERIQQARGVWLFVFKPNDLCADVNQSVGHLID